MWVPQSGACGCDPTTAGQSRPCVVADNYFADPRIPIGGNYRRKG